MRYTYTLSYNVWTQFPDMFIEFNLDSSQWVFIKYHIVTATTQNWGFCTQLYLDGQPERIFNVYQDNSWMYTNTAENSMYLSKGKHTVQVRYWTNSPRLINPNDGWPVAILLVRYKEISA